MFGISFGELLLVALIALLVLGPERLPSAARTAGIWVGRLKRSFNTLKQQVEKEIGADDIRQQLHNEHILSLEKETKKLLSLDLEPTDKQTADKDKAPSPSSVPTTTPDHANATSDPSTPSAEPPRTP